MNHKKKKFHTFHFYYQGVKWNVKKSFHLFENRECDPQAYVRDEFLNDERYTEILKCALRNGLTSFRKKRVVVTLPCQNGTFYSVLCILNEKSDITIITTFRQRLNWWKNFIICKERITVLNDYIIPTMTKKEKEDKQMSKIQYNIVKNNEDKHFRNVMGAIKDLVRF